MQKQHLQQSLAAKQAKQALSDEMEKPYRRFATIEQQLLLREENQGAVIMSEETKPRVLLVDDDASLLKLLAIRIESKGYQVSTVESGIEALQALKNQTYDAVITDLRMDEMDGMALHRQLQSRYPSMPVIMMTAHGSIPDAVEATKQGIFAFITKPVDKDELFDSLAKAIEIHGVHGDETPTQTNIVTRSGAMLHLLEQVKLLGPTQGMCDLWCQRQQ